MTMSDKLQAPGADPPRRDHDLNRVGDPVSKPADNTVEPQTQRYVVGDLAHDQQQRDERARIERKP